MQPLANRRLRMAVRLNHSPSWQWLWSMLCGLTFACTLRAGVGFLKYCSDFLG